MKRKEIIFQKPAKVVQVFRQIHEYTKVEKSFTERKDKLQWREISSPNGYLSNGSLYLPASILADKNWGNCDLVTIEDAADVNFHSEWKMINGHFFPDGSPA